MDLLKDKGDFDTWKEKHIFSGDSADDPREYPCYVSTEVVSWKYEELRAVYIYRTDLEEMISRMDNVIARG